MDKYIVVWNDVAGFCIYKLVTDSQFAGPFYTFEQSNRNRSSKQIQEACRSLNEKAA